MLVKIKYVYVSGMQLAGGEGLPWSFLKIGKSALILEKIPRFVFFYVLNFTLKMLFKEHLGEWTPAFIPAGSFFHVL